MDVLRKIEQLRKERGWSVNYLAMEAGLTQSTLNNLYARRSEPKIVTLKAICSAFGITLSDFFREDETDDSKELTIEGKFKRLSENEKKVVGEMIDLLLTKNN